jgi:peptidoglycan/LPS O-acetylase OafA/YrhL
MTKQFTVETKQNNNTSVQRLDDVVILRSFAIILVVLYHSYGLNLFLPSAPLKSTYTFIFSVLLGGRMPLYVFISGYLFSYLYNQRGKYQSFIPFVKNKFRRLIIPYLVFSVLYWSLLGDSSHFSSLYRQLMQGDSYHFWFLIMLFYCFIVTHLLHRVTNIRLQVLILVLALIIRVIPLSSLPLGLIYFRRFFLWFYFGYFILYNRDKFPILRQTKFVFITLIGWLGCCLLCNNYLIFHVDQSSRLFSAIYFFSFVFSAYLSLLCFVLFCYTFVNKLLQKEKIRPKRWTEKLNKSSYGIYIFHPLFIQLITASHNYPFRLKVINFAIQQPIIFPILIFVYAFFLSWLVSGLLSKTKVGKYLIG